VPPKAVRVGCSGWNYDDWRGQLYPEGLGKARWLERYSERFDTVEVNSTFYRLASPKGVARWVKQTPPDFVFSVKASRYMTHIKRLRDLPLYAARFYEGIDPLMSSGKLGPVLWQLPANFRRDDDVLAAALAALPRGRHAFEFRHESWFEPPVLALLRERNVALVIGDHPERSFQTHDLTADWTLIRFHHGTRGRDGNYSASEIETWARRIAQWRRRVEVFAYFNNDWKGYAIRNARDLAAHLGTGP
jgi:uncharacterized protein YecE (DUF72 family)